VATCSGTPPILTVYNIGGMPGSMDQIKIGKKKPTVSPQWVLVQTNSNWLGQREIRMRDVRQNQIAQLQFCQLQLASYLQMNHKLHNQLYAC
jgi:hypothetical protein